MYLKLFGAASIIVACGSVGWSMAAAHRREEVALEQLVTALGYMDSELRQDLRPLPQLCRSTAQACSGIVSRIFDMLASELDKQIAPNAAVCMDVVLSTFPKIPKLTKQDMERLASCLGRFDLEGQLKGIEAVKLTCCTELTQLRTDRDTKLRNYQTLGLCTGTALAILFL